MCASRVWTTAAWAAGMVADPAAALQFCPVNQDRWQGHLWRAVSGTKGRIVYKWTVVGGGPPGLVWLSVYPNHNRPIRGCAARQQTDSPRRKPR
eukprot:CAMPEP_0198333452 /NCGR_PEP_ID=MMETSP1450-20131203/18961_1 /TAXON_ID=753684 ORGANISM="Madagascaria erythrocladiodes, Strain CCMP3234" /NCGR_SAMPLE_ID=MMETSP1450 /ASSEMBLY_ACC=CAM_ASM_001115 /LENGTH=93 /DNA_ID=CAMNT_0044037971 /DNA_START=367 /DNA_END=648 /DNA_ORIENTATION=+